MRTISAEQAARDRAAIAAALACAGYLPEAISPEGSAWVPPPDGARRYTFSLPLDPDLPDAVLWAVAGALRPIGASVHAVLQRVAWGQRRLSFVVEIGGPVPRAGVTVRPDVSFDGPTNLHVAEVNYNGARYAALDLSPARARRKAIQRALAARDAARDLVGLRPARGSEHCYAAD